MTINFVWRGFAASFGGLPDRDPLEAVAPLMVLIPKCSTAYPSVPHVTQRRYRSAYETIVGGKQEMVEEAILASM